MSIEAERKETVRDVIKENEELANELMKIAVDIREYLLCEEEELQKDSNIGGHGVAQEISRTRSKLYTAKDDLITILKELSGNA